MYSTDFRENVLQDMIAEIEPGLFKLVTGLTVAGFPLSVHLGVFNSTHMNQAVLAFRRCEDASCSLLCGYSLIQGSAHCCPVRYCHHP